LADTLTAEPEEYEIVSNFMGRVENISLAANTNNALKPLFEAVSNALHSVEDRFGTRLDKGKIEIVLISHDKSSDNAFSTYSGYSVRDNGGGFNDDNFKSFRTSDSRRKQKKGGKGVGRLLWLKTADRVVVESQFTTDSKKWKRTFEFVAGEKSQIQKHELAEDATAKSQTTIITVYPFNNTFASHFPKKRETISSAIIRHFLRMLIGDRVPHITVADDEGSDDLRQLLTSAILEKREEQFDVTLDGGFSAGSFLMKHMLIDKQLKDDDRGTNAIHLCAHERGVERHVIDNQVGMTIINGDRFYASVAEADILDKSVNQERSSFSLDKQELQGIESALTARAKDFLSPYIEEIRKEQTQKVEQILRENPHFRPVAASPGDFATNKLALNDQGDEQIYIALSRENRREQRNRDREFKAIAKEQKHTKLVEEKIASYAKFANDVTKGHLESYVRHRKSILDVLSTYRNWEDKDKESHVLENAVHALVCPLGGTTDSLPYDQHNLWMLDERLAFYGYFASDTKIKSFTEEHTGEGEPDLAFFDVGLGFRRDLQRDPVIIVEFKRPDKNNYNHKTDPYRQIVRYIGELTSKKVHDNGGATITQIDDKTVFICYIVADLTNSLLDCLRGTPVNKPTPDGKGRFGYVDDLRAYVEVIPYEKLWDDAYKRNEIFFKKLGLIES
jgi:hypothetical protein